MYRGVTTFKCTECQQIFEADFYDCDNHWHAIPPLCPNCGRLRTMPMLLADDEGQRHDYLHIWEKCERIAKEKEEKRLKSEAKWLANEEKQRKIREKKRKRKAKK